MVEQRRSRLPSRGRRGRVRKVLFGETQAGGVGKVMRGHSLDLYLQQFGRSMVLMPALKSTEWAHAQYRCSVFTRVRALKER